MNIKTLTVGAFESNCYVLEKNGEVLVLDPGADSDRLLAAIGSKPKAILLTHGHMDHLSALPRLCGEWPDVPVYLHAADLAWALRPVNAMPPYYDPIRLEPDRIRPLPAGIWQLEPFAFEALHTPGHTPGGVCFYDAAEGVVFTGDTLFQGTVGRADLPGSNPRDLSESLRLLARLPPATRVYSGHGAQTTIQRELEQNFFLSGAARRNAAEAR